MVLLASWWYVPGAQAQTQERPGEWAWKPLFAHEGVAFTYIFYREADNIHDGVVVKLSNENDYPVAYQFKMLFKADDGSIHTEDVVGSLKAHEEKTGDTAGLFWVPFTDGRSISEIGLRGYKITPRPEKPDA